MSIIKINAITVPGDSGDELARRFAARAGAGGKPASQFVTAVAGHGNRVDLDDAHWASSSSGAGRIPRFCQLQLAAGPVCEGPRTEVGMSSAAALNRAAC